MKIVTKDTTWSDSFVLQPLKFRNLPYNRVATTDRINAHFALLCQRSNIYCEWLPYAGAIITESDTNLTLLSVLRSHAIETVERELFAQREVGNE